MALFARWALPGVLLVAALGLYRLAYSHVQPPAWTPVVQPPARLVPTYNWPQVATDEQLRAVLERMQPPATPNTNRWLHALRMWGPQSHFAPAAAKPIETIADAKLTPPTPSGQTMLSYFLDDKVFLAKNGESVPPLFHFGPTGVEVREWAAAEKHLSSSAAHRDDILATLAESGVPLTTPIVMRDGTTTVERLLADSFVRYHPQQQEYEWSIISYLRYLYPQELPTNRYGEKPRLTELVDELVDPVLRNGTCIGLHRLEAAIILWRLDAERPALPAAAKAKLAAHLTRVSRILVQSQQPEGMWTRAWGEGTQAAKLPKGNRYDQILATGHVLEYLAFAPEQFQPPRETIIRAAQWLCRAFVEETPKELEKNYGPFSHAARALCLWRGQEPWDAWQRVTAPAQENQ